MVLENIAGFVPLTIGGIVWLLIKTFLIFVALVIADKIISHDMNAKHVLIMAFLVAFVVPIITSLALPFIALPAGFSQLIFYGLPLLMWIVFGEVLLGGDYKQKIAVAFIAFAIFTVLDFFGIQQIIFQFLPIPK